MVAACSPGTDSESTAEAPDTPAEATEEPAEAPATDGKVTAEQYAAISPGMTLEEVEAKIGKGTEISNVAIEGAPATVTYQWDADGGFGANITATFQDGALTSKAQFGLAGQEGEKVTLAQYEQVAQGMTLEEVEAVLGKGEESSRVALEGIGETVNYTWYGEPFGSNMVLTFQDGKLTSKVQFGLE